MPIIFMTILKRDIFNSIIGLCKIVYVIVYRMLKQYFVHFH